MENTIKTKDAKKGGYLVGKPHSEGGIKGMNVDTGEPIEVEGGEVVITKPAVQSKEVYMFEGKEMTPKEILSKLNSDHGGVAFAKGGQVGEEHYAKGGGVNEKSVWERNGFIDIQRDSPKEWQLVEWSFNGHSPAFKGKPYYQARTGLFFIQKENGDIYEPKSSNKLFWREIQQYAKGGGTRKAKTTAPSFEAEKELVKKEDKAEKLKYQTLEEIIEQDITKWSALQGLVGQANSFRKNEIDRKLGKLRAERDLYALKQMTSSELLQSLSKVFAKEKVAQEVVNPELLAPNDLPTMLSENQYYKVRTDEFMDWFGDWLLAYDFDNYGGVSKAINEVTKEPLVLYHGSQFDFARWRFDKFPAAYFADNMSYSQWFANLYGTGNLYQVFVDMKSPIDMRSFGVDQYPIRNYLEYIENNYLISPEQIDGRIAQFKISDPENTEKYLDHPCRFWEYIRHINTGILTFLRDKTFFDGILMFENNPSDQVDGKDNVTGSYVVFRKEQIKWASANHFNTLVDDARFEKGGKLQDKQSELDLLNSVDFAF